MKHILSAQDTEALLDVLVEQTGIAKAQLTPAADLVADFSADSLTLMETILAVEERFDVIIPDERSEGLRTVGDFQDLLAELLAARQPATPTTTPADQARE